MKIALVSPYDFAHPGGVTAHIVHLAAKFSQYGHEVKILAPSSKSANALNVENLIPLGYPVPVPSNGSVARISLSPWLVPKVKALLSRENFDVVHVHNPYTPLLPLIALRYSRSVNVATFHGFHEEEKRYRIRKRILKGSFEKIHGFIAVSPPVKEFMNHYYQADYHVIPNSIDVDWFASPLPPLTEFSDGKLNILFLSRLEKRKGLKYLLAAFSRLKLVFPEVRLLIVGPGSPDRECHQIISEHNLQDVHFVGPVSYNELPKYYQAADIFCAPAVGKESFGIVLLEAMASGTPLVASNIDGFRSVVDDDVQGILVKPKDSMALCSALLRLAEHPELRASMAKKGLIHVEQFRSDKIASEVLEFYGKSWEIREKTRLNHQIDTS
jgi:phosphatidylinositol alpha-mannosyltransferase